MFSNSNGYHTLLHDDSDEVEMKQIINVNNVNDVGMLHKPLVENMDGWKWVRPKSGGNTASCGVHGGWYEKNGEEVFFKQDISKFTNKISHPKNGSEVLASSLMRLVVGPTYAKYFAEAILAVRPQHDSKRNQLSVVQLPNPTGNDIYVGSKKIVGPSFKALNVYRFKDALGFHDLYNSYMKKFPNSKIGTYEEVFADLYTNPCVDLYKDAFLAYNFAASCQLLRDKRKGEGKEVFVEIPHDRPKFLETLNSFPIVDVIATGRYQGLARLIALCMFVGNRDVHTANFEAVPIPGHPNIKAAYAIDFAWSFHKYDGKLHFHDKLKYIGDGPTNHIPEYPDEIIISEEFADTLNLIHQFDKKQLEQGISAGIDNLALYYGDQPLIEMAEFWGIKNPKNLKREILIAQCKSFMQFHAVNRQLDARRLELEIRLSIIFEKNASGNYYIPEKNKPNLHKLILENSSYFQERFLDQKKFRFRGWDLQKSLSALTFLINQETAYCLYRVKPDSANIQTVVQTEYFSSAVAPQLNSLMAQPDSFLSRLKNAYKDIFDSGSMARFTKNKPLKYLLMLWPFPNPKKNNFYNHFEWVLQLGGAIGFIKNIVKLVFEFVPAIIENAGLHVYDASKRTLAIESFRRTKTETALAYLGEMFGGAFYLTFAGLRLLTMRITSPIKSMKQAYRFGNKRSIYAGILLAGLSAAVTIAGMTLLVAVATPFVLTLVGLVGSAATAVFGAKIVGGIATAAQSIGSIPYIGPALSSLSTLAPSTVFFTSAALAVRSAAKRISKPLTRALKKCWDACFKKKETVFELPISSSARMNGSSGMHDNLLDYDLEYSSDTPSPNGIGGGNSSNSYALILHSKQGLPKTNGHVDENKELPELIDLGEEIFVDEPEPRPLVPTPKNTTPLLSPTNGTHSNSENGNGNGHAEHKYRVDNKFKKQLSMRIDKKALKTIVEQNQGIDDISKQTIR